MNTEPRLPRPTSSDSEPQDDLEWLVGLFDETHESHPSPHEATPHMQERIDQLYAIDQSSPASHTLPFSDETLYPPTQINPSAERRFESDDRLSPEGYEVTESLRRQRIKGQQEIIEARAAGKETGNKIWYSRSEAQFFLMQKDVAIHDAIAVLRELEAMAAHEANIWAERDTPYQTVEEAKKREYNPTILGDLMNVSPTTIQQLATLKGDDGAFFRRIQKVALEEAQDHYLNYDRVAVKARLEGFVTVKDKYDAMRRGDHTPDPELEKMGLIDVFLIDQPFELDEQASSSLMMEYCHEYLGLSEELSSELFVAMQGACTGDSNSLRTSQNSMLDTDMMENEFGALETIVARYGAHTINELRSTCGIVNITELSDRQLDRMVRFMNDDPELIDELNFNEVCVVIRDATADYNGAFRGTYRQFEPEDGTMLAFEISSMKGYGRQLWDITQLLKERGVMPSVLVFAGHGKPGAVQFGDGMLLPDTRSTVDGMPYASLTVSGIDDVIASMRPDRDGNTHIIYNSCSLGSDIGLEKEVEPVSLESPLANQATSTQKSDDVEDAIFNRPSPHNGLTATAVHARRLRRDLTVQVVGMDSPGAMYREFDGELRDHFKQALTRIVAPANSDEVYRQYTGDVEIPMYVRQREEEA